MCSTEITKILLEIEGQAMKDQRKPKPMMRDYTRENIKRLKEIQANCKKREQQQNARLPLKATSEKYSRVPSKIASSLQSMQSPSTSLLPLENCELATIKIVPSVKLKNNQENSSSGGASGVTQKNGAALRRSSSLSELSTSKTATAETTLQKKELRKTPSSTQLNVERKSSSHEMGKVPKYLIERKKKWREEAEVRRRNAPDPTIPPGHTMLSEKERLETLTLLQKNHQSLLRQMATLPVRTDTLRLRQRKEEIEKQLTQTEEAIVIFSRPRVLIKHES